MSRKFFACLISFLLLFAPTLSADPEKKKTQQELRALKMQQSKLQAKERLLRLKQSLNLEESQLQAWQTYSEHMLSQPEKKAKMVATLRQQGKKEGLPTSIDLADANIRRLEAQLKNAREQRAAFSAFYQALNEEQRSIIDKSALKKVKREARKVRDKRKKAEKSDKVEKKKD